MKRLTSTLAIFAMTVTLSHDAMATIDVPVTYTVQEVPLKADSRS